MTHDKLSAIRDRAVAMARRPNLSAGYCAELRHIARDAQAALDGCRESLASVEAFIATDHDLSMAGSTPAFAPAQCEAKLASGSHFVAGLPGDVGKQEPMGASSNGEGFDSLPDAKRVSHPTAKMAQSARAA